LSTRGLARIGARTAFAMSVNLVSAIVPALTHAIDNPERRKWLIAQREA
jgi:hypothetical protein